jgi:hypothetical protein
VVYYIGLLSGVRDIGFCEEGRIGALTRFRIAQAVVVGICRSWCEGRCEMKPRVMIVRCVAESGHTSTRDVDGGALQICILLTQQESTIDWRGNRHPGLFHDVHKWITLAQQLHRCFSDLL